MSVKRAFLIPYVFVMLNWASVVGLYCFLRGDDGVWR